MDFKRDVAELLAKSLKLEATQVYKLLESPPDETLGDYALPCFGFAKTLKKAPQQIAEDFSKKVATDGLIERVETVGPYLNLFLKKEQLIKETVERILKEQQAYGKGKRQQDHVMVEYSQPNTHKAFHVGHLRGTSIGESLARILRYAGYKVTQTNYSGDTGMHVAKWIWCYKTFHDGEEPPKGELGKWLASFYVEAVKRLEKNPSLEEEVRELNRKLDEGKDKELTTLWKRTRQWSIDELNDIYAELDAHFDYWFWEREMEERAKAASKELLKKGVAKESDGAIIMDLEEYGLGIWVLLRDDGTPLYSAKDLALAEEKFRKYKIDKSIHVVGKDQELYFKQLFKTLELWGFKQANKCFHLGFEMVRLPEGKMSSRTGQNILYTDLRNEVFAYTEQEIRKRHDDWSDEHIAAVVKAVGICALKFEMIHRDHNKTIIFDAAKVCDFEGDTGPYIQYTHARCNSILKKLGRPVATAKADFSAMSTEQEYRVAKKLGAFPEIIVDVATSLYPEQLAKYALELAKAFNKFYHECPVIGSPQEAGRASLVDATRIVLEQSLVLLGIQAPAEM